MHQFLKNIIVFFIMIVIMECISYYKDYKHLYYLNSYISYDLKNNDLKSFSTDTYQVIIKEDEYFIIYKRKPILLMNFLKKIKYHGII